MATTSNVDEVRVRVMIDREMPELFNRLANSKRQSREVVHLLRLGLHMEQILKGNAQLPGSTGTMGMPSQAPVANATGLPQTEQLRKAEELVVASDPVKSSTDFAEEVGIGAEYFDAPTSYKD